MVFYIYLISTIPDAKNIRVKIHFNLGYWEEKDMEEKIKIFRKLLRKRKKEKRIMSNLDFLTDDYVCEENNIEDIRFSIQKFGVLHVQ